MHFIEPLEPRIAPALVTPTVTAGVLLIQHKGGAGETAENIVVDQIDADSFNVKDTLVGADFGPFDAVKSIVVQAANLGDQIDLKFTHDGLGGSLDISIAGPAIAAMNTINLLTVDTKSGLITGKVNILGGADDDTVNVKGGLAIAGAVTFTGGKGTDTFAPGDSTPTEGVFLAKKLTLDSVEHITVDNSSPPVVIGGMLVENEDADSMITFSLSRVATIAGLLTYCGSDSVPEDVTLNGEFLGNVKLMLLGNVNTVTTAGTYSGNLSITGGGDVDTVTFQSKSLNFNDPTKGPFINATVAGKTSLNLGDGANTVTLQDISYFAKDLSITTGSDADTVNLTQFSAAKNVTLSLGGGANELNGSTFSTRNFVGGKFKYAGGLGVDDVDLDFLIAGSIDVALGDGANNVNGAMRITGKSAKFTSGAGADTFNISLASTGGALIAKLGAGNDTFTFNGGALASAKLDGGADDGVIGDTLNGVTLLPTTPGKTKIGGFEH